jgi:hypothetical protein
MDIRTFFAKENAQLGESSSRGDFRLKQAPGNDRFVQQLQRTVPVVNDLFKFSPAFDVLRLVQTCKVLREWFATAGPLHGIECLSVFPKDTALAEDLNFIKRFPDITKLCVGGSREWGGSGYGGREYSYVRKVGEFLRSSPGALSGFTKLQRLELKNVSLETPADFDWLRSAATQMTVLRELVLEKEKTYVERTEPTPPLPALPPSIRTLTLKSFDVNPSTWQRIAALRHLQSLLLWYCELDRTDISVGFDGVGSPWASLQSLDLRHTSHLPPAILHHATSLRRLTADGGHAAISHAALEAMAQHGSLEQLLLDSSRDDGDALAKPHAPVLSTLIRIAPRLSLGFSLTGTDLNKEQAQSLFSALPPAAATLTPAWGQLPGLRAYDYSMSEDARNKQLGHPCGRISPEYDRYGANGWGGYSRRHDSAAEGRQLHGFLF